MKTKKSSRIAMVIYFTMVTALMMTFSTASAQKVKFLNSSVVPAAKGKVIVKQDNNDNYVIKVEIEDLAEVERMQPAKESYVVWMETDNGNTENLGQLVSSKSFLSKQKTASLETVSSYKPVKIFVTAERGTSVQVPGNQVVLTTDNF